MYIYIHREPYQLFSHRYDVPIFAVVVVVRLHLQQPCALRMLARQWANVLAHRSLHTGNILTTDQCR